MCLICSVFSHREFREGRGGGTWVQLNDSSKSPTLADTIWYFDQYNGPPIRFFIVTIFLPTSHGQWGVSGYQMWFVIMKCLLMSSKLNVNRTQKIFQTYQIFWFRPADKAGLWGSILVVSKRSLWPKGHILRYYGHILYIQIHYKLSTWNIILNICIFTLT